MVSQGAAGRDALTGTTERRALDNNRGFAAYVVLVVGGASVLLATLVLAGIATLPPLATFLTDVALGLGIRAAYKQVGGWDWNEWTWSFAGDAPQAAAAAVELPEPAEDFARAA